MSFEQSELDINFLSLVVALSNFTYKVDTSVVVLFVLCLGVFKRIFCAVGAFHIFS